MWEARFKTGLFSSETGCSSSDSRSWKDNGGKWVWRLPGGSSARYNPPLPGVGRAAPSCRSNHRTDASSC